MHLIDIGIIAAYMVAMLAIGVYFMRKHDSVETYFVGNRRIGWGHVGLSVVATDVGGGFSIGLGGLGFAMGISGSWLLFTGLVGAWLSAVLVIPRVKPLGDSLGWTTYPDFLAHRFGESTRAVAAAVSAIGYASFVGAQILAGAVLLEGAFGIDRTVGVCVMTAVVVGYTALGGLQAVIFTDTIQWLVLFGGLAFFALPFAVSEAGGLGQVIDTLPDGHLSFGNVTGMQIATWATTIIPIWFVANTLYQRIYATRDVRAAKRAWYMAGLLEWPLLALLGTALGAVARVLFPELSIDDAELAVPLLIREVLPVGVVGVVIAVYFSAIMSTADSCLLAAVGHLVSDFYARFRSRPSSDQQLRLSRWLSLLIGVAAAAIAIRVPSVLDAILLSYSFMVSGLFVPTLGALLWPRVGQKAALASMLSGGTCAVLLQIPLLRDPLSGILQGADPAFVAIPLAALVLVVVTLGSAAAKKAG